MGSRAPQPNLTGKTAENMRPTRNAPSQLSTDHRGQGRNEARNENRITKPAASSVAQSPGKTTKHSKNSSKSNSSIRNRRPARQDSNTSENKTYNIFGSPIRRAKLLQRRNYRPEYNKIELPEKPENLICAICGQTIRGVDLREAVEVVPGEFALKLADKPDGPKDMARLAEQARSSSSAHFKCVLEAMSEGLQLQKGQSVAYLGAGKFALVEGSRRTVVQIIERGQWSQTSNLSPTNWTDWRQNMSSPTLIAALSIETDV